MLRVPVLVPVPGLGHLESCLACRQVFARLQPLHSHIPPSSPHPVPSTPLLPLSHPPPSPPPCSVLRRSTTLLVVAGEHWLFAKRPSRRSLAALLLMVGGAVVAGLTDLTFNAAGYAWVSICVVSTAAYLLLIRKLQESTGDAELALWPCSHRPPAPSTSPERLPLAAAAAVAAAGLEQNTLLLYNNVLALPLMAGFLLLGTREVAEVARYPRLWSPSFQLFLLLSCSQAFLLNLCIFRWGARMSAAPGIPAGGGRRACSPLISKRAACGGMAGHLPPTAGRHLRHRPPSALPFVRGCCCCRRCTLVNSPLATNVTGQMKDILTTALGMVLFAGARTHAIMHA